MLAELASVVAPVLTMALLGYLWSRSGAPFDTDTVSRVVLYIGAPCLIFHSLTTSTVDARALSEMAGMAALAMVSFVVVGALLLRLFRLPSTTFLGALVFTNSGNLGLPLCLFAFGEEGLSLGVAFFTVSFVAHTSLGPALFAGERSLRPIVTSPLAWAAALSVVVASLDVPVPPWIGRTTELLGGVVIPLMLLTLGVSLSRLEARHVSRSAIAAALRLAMGIGVGFGLAELAGMTGTSRGVFILECATPVGVMNYIFAAKYDRSPEEVAGAVLLSTLGAMVTLPVVLWWLMPGR